MQPYVIKQGDYLAKLAYKFGFDADAVWGDDKNADLRQARSDHNILAPTDILYIPDPDDPVPITLQTGTTNSFVSSVPTKIVTIRFMDDNLASQSCTIAELDYLIGLTTDSEGILEFEAPVTLKVATVTFPEVEGGATCACGIGQLDPINTLSGIWQRLQNLGYVDHGLAFDPTNVEAIRDGLRALKYSSPEGPGGSEGSGDSDSDESGDSDSAPASNSSPDADSSPNSDDPPESADSTPDHVADAGPTWNEGLDDDGTLDAKVSKRLLAAHGC